MVTCRGLRRWWINYGRGALVTKIKLVGPEDHEILRNPMPEVFDHPVRDDLLREFLEDPRHHMAIAVEGESVVGFGSAVHYVHPDKEPELWINEVGVAPNHRRRGIGRDLVQALLDLAVELGCREAWVLTEGENCAARRLYSLLGGVTPGSDPVMYSFALGRRTEPPGDGRY